MLRSKHIKIRASIHNSCVDQYPDKYIGITGMSVSVLSAHHYLGGLIATLLDIYCAAAQGCRICHHTV